MQKNLNIKERGRERESVEGINNLINNVKMYFNCEGMIYCLLIYTEVVNYTYI